MPCYRCGARQTDPERGPSPWKRAVARVGTAGEHQVLICPSCQRLRDWAAGLQACAGCGSLHLVRRLDQVECLECRLVREAMSRQERVPPARDGALAAEVAKALDRLLGKSVPGQVPEGHSVQSHD
jgi:hypothetical protein